MIPVLQIAPLVPSVQSELEARYEVHQHPAPEETLAGIRAVVTDGMQGAPTDLLQRLPALEFVASAGVGYDGLDLAWCRARGVRASYTPDVLNDAVAELTLALMLAHARRIPQYDAYARAGRWAADGMPPLTAQIAGARVGLLGIGRIGQEIASRLVAMKAEVAYHARAPREGLPYDFRPDPVALARRSDWLVAIMPATPETRGIVSREVLEALGPDGVFVNVGRGALHDEAALIELLATGALGGAALDVFGDEPRIPEALRHSPKVTLSPHMGSATVETRRAMSQLTLDNLDAHFAGRPLPSEIPA
ncbi:MAG TPA: 2-hydroxyacid dehydrogenase [Paracoccaceae bacterium]|nr:2-hydroxyacid dehydrogenase [Paracoccaceae bacterium]